MGIEMDRGGQSVSESNQSGATNAQGSGGVLTTGALTEERAPLSESDSQVPELALMVSRLPEVRQERVFALWEAVQSGRYDVSAEQIAGAVLMHIATYPRDAPE
jgi:flagellar biosynthesis anti-sigma factor FlgM